MIEIIEFKANQDLMWPWKGNPYFSIPALAWRKHIEVDPTPAYANELSVIKEISETVWNSYPIDREVVIASLDREGFERTNGQTESQYIYDDEVKKKTGEYSWESGIILFGKRIPPHPAMSRYLVAHEYGHVIRRYLQWKRAESDNDYRKLYDEYEVLREFKTAKYYGAGSWHACVEELFANDFRILVTGVENEYWPHPGFKRPEEVPAIIDFWEQAKKLSYTEKVDAPHVG